MNMGKNMHEKMHKNMGNNMHQKMHMKHPRKKTWKELSPRAKIGTIVGAVVQLTLLVAAQRDISRRPRRGNPRQQGDVEGCHPGELHRSGMLFHLRCEAPSRSEIGLASRPPGNYWTVAYGRR